MARKAAKSSSSGSSKASARGGVVEDVRRLVELMVENDLGELDVTDGERQIHLKRAIACMPQVSALPAVAPAAQQAPAQQGAAQEPEAPSETLLEIKSPMVGTYYSSSSPDSDAFVRAGSQVDSDTVVCIVEAMKVMNEVKADCAGTIAEVCVQNAQPVEYGQVLFRVRP